MAHLFTVNNLLIAIIVTSCGLLAQAIMLITYCITSRDTKVHWSLMPPPNILPLPDDYMANQFEEEDTKKIIVPSQIDKEI